MIKEGLTTVRALSGLHATRCETQWPKTTPTMAPRIPSASGATKHYRLQTTYYYRQTTDRLQTDNRLHTTTDYILLPTDYRLQTTGTDCSDCRLHTNKYKLQTTDRLQAGRLQDYRTTGLQDYRTTGL